jgi:uncharacterized protein (UPF0332 family)/predicted nucleotidyltransferase
VKDATVHPAIAGDAAWQGAVREYIERLREHYGDRLSAVVLFGSRARGDSDAESDVDLLVVLSGAFDRTAERELTFDFQQDLEEKYHYPVMGTIVATEDDYRRRMLPLFMNIRREGIEVWPVGPNAVREDRPDYGEDAAPESAAIRQLMIEALDDARAGLEQGRHRWAVNRGYYAMFYAATALLLSEGLAFSRHRGVINAFSERFIKTGRFPGALGGALSRAFQIRNVADYAPGERITAKQASEVVRNAEEFVSTSERLLDQ